MPSRLLRALPAAALLLLAACGERTTAVNELNTKTVTLPDGHKVQAEMMIREEDMMRGMMFRESLPTDRGLLFMHQQPGLYPYWMYQVKVPLDIIWLDPQQRVVEISANTPPCKETSARLCPNYGGKKPAQFVLELAGGEAAKHSVTVGTQLSF
jgi:uncharacterized protein